MQKKKIVFIGCGYVSVWAFKSLYSKFKSQIKNGEVEITLLSKSAGHDFHGFTGEFINGFLPLKFRSTPHENLFRHSKYIQGKLLKINPENQIISYCNEENGEIGTLDYDHVIVGAGSYDHFQSIHGANEYGLSVKKANGISQLRKKLIQNLIKAELSGDPKEINHLLSFTVVGAGLAGVEVSGNLVETLNDLKEEFPILKHEGFKVNLVYSSDEILPQLEKKKVLRNYSIKTLRKLGVNLYSNSRVQSINDYSVEFSNGENLPTSFVVFTTGQTNDAFIDNVKSEAKYNNRITVKSTLQSEAYENVWSGGDAAIVKRPYFEKTCNHDALWAIKHGSRIGKNISRTLKGKEPGSFKYPGLGQTAAFYKNKAILEIYSIPITGRLAFMVRIGFFLYFMPSRKNAFKALKSILFDKDQRKEGWKSIISNERAKVNLKNAV
ncbi:NAD(P)/FAD-dependent oxidoreductase [Brumimicrobium mesophilum]|uniref:NAD(P)/FAD-dependent oxidoreductase n=1 Tax=Brumimicrobium mesophilum TaxID=392717 RepID=UPI00131ABCCE|nr:FAD-dependent oxidoreductase [Brumimicrobium mesophilum]